MLHWPGAATRHRGVQLRQVRAKFKLRMVRNEKGKKETHSHASLQCSTIGQHLLWTQIALKNIRWEPQEKKVQGLMAKDMPTHFISWAGGGEDTIPTYNTAATLFIAVILLDRRAL